MRKIPEYPPIVWAATIVSGFVIGLFVHLLATSFGWWVPVAFIVLWVAIGLPEGRRRRERERR